MDSRRFDTLARNLGKTLSRRAVSPLLGGLLAVVPLGPLSTAAKKKKKKKKTTLCLDGQTIQASKKKKKKLLKSGATQGACSSPPPPGCTPSCAANACGGDDGCGGICVCAAGSICHGEVCQSCTVSCSGSSAGCGTDLNTRLAGGGTVYACPGRYVGNFTLGLGVVLIGAGKGNDPAVDTILDANGTGRVLDIASGVTATLSRLRITGGNAPSGGGILNQGRLTIDDCAVVNNSAGGGIAHQGAATGLLKISNSTVADNTASAGGGFYLTNSAQAVTIDTCVISGNACTSVFCEGGGIYNENTPVIISGSQITGNSAAVSGGGIYNDSGTVTFDSASSVTDNTAPDGGGIYNDAGIVTLNGADVSNNTGGNCAPPASVEGCVG